MPSELKQHDRRADKMEHQNEGKPMKDEIADQAWNHFCQIVGLNHDARLLLKRQGIGSVQSFYNGFNFWQRNGAEKLFAFDKNNLIQFPARARLRLAWSWLEDNVELVQDGAAFCAQFGASYAGEARAAKKRKAGALASSSSLVLVNSSIHINSSPEEVLQWLSSEAPKWAVMHPDDTSYCDPLRVPITWKEKEIRTELQKGRSDLIEFLQEDLPKTPRVLAVRLGTGCGKTHILRNTSQMLNGKEIYVTYNMGQSLSQDIETSYERGCILLRVLLLSFGSSNKGCDAFFLSEMGQVLLGFGVLKLRELTVHHLKKFNQGNQVVIAVDESGLLDQRSGTKKAVIVLSELGEIAHQLAQMNTQCTVIASTLSIDTFATESDRRVHWLEAPVIETSALDFVARQVFPQTSLDQGNAEEIRSMIEAAAGLHFRSIVQAAKIFSEGILTEDTVSTMMQELSDRLYDRVGHDHKICIRNYVKKCISHGEDAEIASVTPYVDSMKAVAPCLIWTSFTGDSHPAKELFRTSAFVPKEKQLELCAFQYDLFRAREGLPVVPSGVRVHNTPFAGWFQKLRFASNLKKSGDSIFFMRNKLIARTTTTLELDSYYLPTDFFHPWIDRACLCYHEDSGEQCLVLYQDKINNDLPTALDSLCRAAETLLQERNLPNRVLCIANIAGASLQTTSQRKFPYPYILVCNDELETFYSVNFAPAIRFVRLRHTNED